MVDLRGRRSNESLGPLDRRHGDDRRRIDHRRLVAVHLLGGEYRRCPGKKACFSLGLTGVSAAISSSLVEDDESGFLALADLRADLGPLAVSAPCAGAVAAFLGISPE